MIETINTVPLTAWASQPIVTSKGNQPKWRDSDFWYKADFMGYESLAETVVAELLRRSNITDVADVTAYVPVYLDTARGRKVGCRSANFQRPGECLFSIERLHRLWRGRSLLDVLNGFNSVKEKIRYTVNMVEENTGLLNFGPYLAMMLQADCFFLNEDRHTNNIAVIYDIGTDKYRLCPIFDNGLAVLADTSDYTMDTSLYDNISRVQAKPFDTSFTAQARAAEKLYDTHLKFAFNRGDVQDILSRYADVYPEKVLTRVFNVICEQMHTNPSLFQKRVSKGETLRSLLFFIRNSAE